MRIDEVLIDRAAVESLAERIAAKYKANEYEEFEAEMYNLMPALRSGIYNLPQLFDLYNPHRQHEGAVSWNHMLKQAKQGIYPTHEGREPLRKAKVGDTIRVGQEGTRINRLDRIERITPSGIVKTKGSSLQYNNKTGMAKGQPTKIFAQIASEKDKEQDFRKNAIDIIKRSINKDISTEKLEAILKQLRISMYDWRTGKYTDID